MIKEIKKFLERSFTDEGYYIKEFSNNVYFGKDSFGNYIFARVNSTNEKSFSFKTKTITVYQNYDFVFTTENDIISNKFDVLILDSKFSYTLETFAKLCFNFYDNNDNVSITKLTEDLIELYKVIGTGDYQSQQGLWAELFTILYVYKHYGINTAKYWHSDNYNKYDFSINERLKLEVKSTIKEYREHNFSHEQIFTNNDVIVASVMMRKDDSGLTISDLFNEIEFLFSDEYERFKLLKLELLKHSENNLLKFDLNYAFKNIKFFDNKKIPKFNIPEPDGVHGTTYCAQLEMIDSLGDEVAEIIKGNKI